MILPVKLRVEFFQYLPGDHQILSLNFILPNFKAPLLCFIRSCLKSTRTDQDFRPFKDLTWFSSLQVISLIRVALSIGFRTLAHYKRNLKYRS